MHRCLRVFGVGAQGIKFVHISKELGQLSHESCTEVVSHLTINKCHAKNVGETDNIKAITVPNLTGVYSVAWLEQ